MDFHCGELPCVFRAEQHTLFRAGSNCGVLQNASHDPLEVVFMRLGVLKKTTIHPRPWSGPGLVGVKLVHVREQRS